LRSYVGQMSSQGVKGSESDADAPVTVGFSLRLLSACSGSFATAMVVTPLDVAKVQMQAANSKRDTRAGVTAVQHIGCRQFICSNGISEHCFDKRDGRWRRRFPTLPCSKTACVKCPKQQAPVAHKANPNGLVATLRTIFVEEGARGLYAGLPPTLLLSVPSNVLYFATYESMRDGLRHRVGNGSNRRGIKRDGMLAPCIAGGTARLVAATVCAPIEIIRTRVQAARLIGGGPDERKALVVLRRLVQKEGMMALFKGLESTLWRDVPFSALYWAGVETIRRCLVHRGWWKDSHYQAPFTSVFAGCMSGGLAAFVTTPFDVVKTRRQVEALTGGVKKRSPARAMTCVYLRPDWNSGCVMYLNSGCALRPALGTGASVAQPVFTLPWATTVSSQSITLWADLRAVAREEGAAALMTGATPRVARVAPACAIMLGTYEMTKMAFAAQ